MTSNVTIYHIPKKIVINHLKKEPCCLNIIDTPGFADTRGESWDKKISNMISTLLNKNTGMKTLDYVLLAVNGTTNRLSSQVKYIYDSI